MTSEELRVLGALTTRGFRETALEDEQLLIKLADPGQGFVRRQSTFGSDRKVSSLTRAGALVCEMYKTTEGVSNG